MDSVELITEPSRKRLSARTVLKRTAIRAKIVLSIRAHGLSVVAICGHSDCAANNVDPDRHMQQIRAAMAHIDHWDLGVEVIRYGFRTTG